MEKVEATEFKDQCLELLDNLVADGLIITQDGAPVARVLSYVRSDGDVFAVNDGDLIGSLRNELKIKGDVFTTGCRWEADARD